MAGNRLLSASKLSVAAYAIIVAAGIGLAAEMGRIDGRIVLSPAVPASRTGEPNQRPIEGRVTVIDARGEVAARMDSDKSGAFHIELPPGHYTLRLETAARMGRAQPAEVTVSAGQVTKAVITFDAGIR